MKTTKQKLLKMRHIKKRNQKCSKRKKKKRKGEFQGAMGNIKYCNLHVSGVTEQEARNNERNNCQIFQT